MRYLTLTFLITLAACASQSMQTVQPVTVQLSEDSNPEFVGKALKLSLIERGWTITSEKPGEMTATLSHTKSQQVVNIAATYGAAYVTFLYVDGYRVRRDMDDRGQIQIKRGEPYRADYERWISNLSRDVPIYVRRLIVLAE